MSEVRTVTEYRFHAVMRDESIQWYPAFVTVDADNRHEAIQKMADENRMTVVNHDANSVWMSVPSGSMVKYEILERKRK
ncbi:hypothetical protein [Alicyclobacillus dauci]|uniref:Uncharacterized protein n=1 Tax=Alicyclobacillus dauci TaxID=1475485 RepID=A0ABY6YZK8_9BACL|nr:hypothetical protein [Alicyclobacillus dauci]WAH36017.1 hypothetical protein NZD86_17400 [Alicyclobacillus dauci]